MFFSFCKGKFRLRFSLDFTPFLLRPKNLHAYSQNNYSHNDRNFVLQLRIIFVGGFEKGFPLPNLNEVYFKSPEVKIVKVRIFLLHLYTIFAFSTRLNKQKERKINVVNNYSLMII